MNITEVKGILLDVDGTLYYQAPVRLFMIILLIINGYSFRKCMRTLKVIRHYRRSQEKLRSENFLQENSGDLQMQLTSEVTNEPVSFVKEVVEEWLGRRPLPFVRMFRRNGMEKCLRKWHGNSLKLGVFSDYPVRDKLKALGITDYIKVAVSSFDKEVRGFKPRTNGFAVAADKMGLEPYEILYIGDRPDIDGVGALNAGMKVIILNIGAAGSGEFTSFRTFNKLYNMI